MRTLRRAAILTIAMTLGAAGSAAATPANGLVSLPDEAGQVILGAGPNDQLGVALAGPGDVDGDGRTDLVAGTASFYGTGSASAAYVLRGGNGGLLALSGPAVPPPLGYAIRGANSEALRAVGSTAAAVGDVNGDKRPDVAVANGSGHVFVVYGRAGQRPTVELGATIAAADGFEIAQKPDRRSVIASAGDFNGDGFGDVAVGDPGVEDVFCDPYDWNDQFCTPAEGRAAELKIVFGRTERTAPVDVTKLTPADGVSISLTQAAIGLQLASAGDVNGDGFGDVVVGRPQDGAGGRAYVILGAATPPDFAISGDDMPQSRGFVLVPPNVANGEFGAGVGAAGDVNGDKLADIVVGAPGLGDGVAWIVYGRKLGSRTEVSVDNFTLGETIVGPAGKKAGFGAAVAGAGDVNADGRGDILVAAPGATYTTVGAAYVVRSLGTPGSTKLPGTPGIDPARGFVIRGGPGDGGYDMSVAGLGGGKVAIGFPVGGGGYAGVVYVLSTAATSRKFLPVSFTVTSVPKFVHLGTRATFTITTGEAAAVSMQLYRVESRKLCRQPQRTGQQRFCTSALIPLTSSARLLAGRASGRRPVSFSTRLGGKAIPKGNYVAALRAGAGARRSLLRLVKFSIR